MMKRIILLIALLLLAGCRDKPRARDHLKEIGQACRERVLQDMPPGVPPVPQNGPALRKKLERRRLEREARQWAEPPARGQHRR